MGKGDEGLFQHLVAVRYRVKGAGNLRTTAISFQEVSSSELNPIPMEATTDKLPSVLSNFTSQGMQVEFKISEIDETFVISRIVVFLKPSMAGGPQL